MGKTVVMIRLSTLEEALVLKTALESAGIWTAIDERNQGFVRWQHAPALSGFRLRVAEDDAEDAAKLITVLRNGEFQTSSEPSTAEEN